VRPWPRTLPLVTGAVAAAAVAGLPAYAPVCGLSRALLGISDRLADGRAVALTFDDGPHPAGTPAALEMLERLGIRATFFLVGEQVDRRPGLAADIAERGHEIALHSYHHRVTSFISAKDFCYDLDRAADAVARATGLSPSLYRPPRGVFTYSSLAEVRRRGLRPVLWAADGRDWRGSATPASIARRIVSRLRGGEVVLLHDSDFYAAPGSFENTVAAIPGLVDGLTALGLSTCTFTGRSLAG
jgi:peptidoglycan/xylan/chitin deacetylase (PgdA/CDA1 family)